MSDKLIWRQFKLPVTNNEYNEECNSIDVW